MTGPLPDDTVLLAENEEAMQRLVNEFDRMRKRRKLELNVGKRKGRRKLVSRWFCKDIRRPESSTM